MSYLGKTVPVASIASTQEGRALLEANNVEEQRSLLSVDSTAESDAKFAEKQNNLVVNDPAVKTALNATGAAPIYACRAWVNFDGTGVVAIRASGNVSSITDVGVGRYIVNFATAIDDNSYNVVTGIADDNVARPFLYQSGTHDQNKTVNSIRIYSGTDGTLVERSACSISIFR